MWDDQVNILTAAYLKTQLELDRMKLGATGVQSVSPADSKRVHQLNASIDELDHIIQHGVIFGETCMQTDGTDGSIQTAAFRNAPHAFAITAEQYWSSQHRTFVATVAPARYNLHLGRQTRPWAFSA